MVIHRAHRVDCFNFKSVLIFTKRRATTRDFSYQINNHRFFQKDTIREVSHLNNIQVLTRQFSSSSLIQDNIMQKSNEEIIIQCSDGIQLAAKKWTVDDQPTQNILCLHGWLDNAASFHLLAPSLSSTLSAQVVALDFPGHGHSSHKSTDGPTQIISEYALYVAEALTKMKWMDKQHPDKKVTLVGHSMGAAVAMIFAASFPEYVDKLVLLDGLAPQSKTSTNVSRHIRTAIERRMKSNETLYPSFSNINSGYNTNDNQNNTKNGKRKYPHIDAAIAARMKTATFSPGNQYISREATMALVGRATIRADEEINNKVAGGEEIPPTYQGPLYFRHDSRLMWPSFHYFSQDQVYAMLSDVQCTTCIVMANDGWPIDENELEKALGILEPHIFLKLPGSHHAHADPEDFPAISAAIHDFLSTA